MRRQDVPNWDEIKSEYLSTDISLVKLAQKHGLSRSMVQREASRGGWIDLQSVVRNESVQQTVEKMVAKRMEHIDEAMDIADVLIEKLRVASQMVDPQDVQKLRLLIQSVKDMVEMGAINIDKTEKNLQVIFADEVAHYAK